MLLRPVAPSGRGNRAAEDDLAFIVVDYRYSTSSDRALTEEATWSGQVPGRSLATVMSELRRVQRGATNISIARVEWKEDGEGAPATPERVLMAIEALR